MREDDAGEFRLSDGAFKYFGEVNDGLLLGVVKLVNGAAGARLVRASVRSTEDVFGTGHWCGNNCTVLALLSALLFLT